jgi:hypothetical protein
MKLRLKWSGWKEESGLRPNRTHSVPMESGTLSTIRPNAPKNKEISL